MKYRHPFLVGNVGAAALDEIDVSKVVRLNDTFFNAAPAQDSSTLVPLVDGSTLTITNHSLAGSATIQVIPGAGVVGEGDLIAAAHLVIGSKDTMGGTFTIKEFIGALQRTTIFYGVGWKNVPHLILAGNAVVPYPMVMVYTGWLQGVSLGQRPEQLIWAVGNKFGVKDRYKPYAIQREEALRLGGIYGFPEDTSGQPIEDAEANFNAYTEAR
jgi:hypothetical protein